MRSSWGGQEMGGQPRSAFHFYTQVKEAGRQKILMWQIHPHRGFEELSSPQIMESKGTPFLNISTDQLPEVVISIPVSRRTQAEAGVGKGCFSQLYILCFSYPPLLDPTSNCVWEILGRDLFVFPMKKRFAGQDSLNHTANVFLSP